MIPGHVITCTLTLHTAHLASTGQLDIHIESTRAAYYNARSDGASEPILLGLYDEWRAWEEIRISRGDKTRGGVR